MLLSLPKPSGSIASVGWNVAPAPYSTDPAQRWKMVYWDRPDPSMSPGICLAASADGLEWEPLFGRPIITNANDAMSMIDANVESRLATTAVAPSGVTAMPPAHSGA